MGARVRQWDVEMLNIFKCVRLRPSSPYVVPKKRGLLLTLLMLFFYAIKDSCLE